MGAAVNGLAEAQENTKPKTKAKTSVKGDESPLPYTASYSSQFVMGDPAKGRIILALWKDFDENAFERNIDILADTVNMYFANGIITQR